MLTVAIPKRNKLQNIIVLTPKDGYNYNIPLFENQDWKRKTRVKQGLLFLRPACLSDILN